MNRKSLWRVLVGKPVKWAKKRPRPTLRAALDPCALIVNWWTDVPNWGDALNPVLVRHLSGREPEPFARVVNLRGRPVYSVIGSVLDGSGIRNLEVWGSGFKHPDTRFFVRPRKIHAVRGPLTRERALAQGVECPDVVGDPVLLMPRFYRPPRKDHWKLGIIPHYLDRERPAVQRLRARDDVRFIDVLGGLESFLDEICACEVVASSSLHGLVAADAYGVDSVWVHLSDQLRGGTFKFMDYFRSVNRPQERPVPVTEHTSMDTILAARWSPRVRLDTDRLLEACPFRAGASG